MKAYLLCLLAGKIPEKLGDYHNSEWQSYLFLALSNYFGYWKGDKSRSERMASSIFCQRPLLCGKEWTALAHCTRGMVFLWAVNQLPERKHDVFQIITEDDKVLFCQRQVSEFRPQLRFPNEKAPLSSYDSVLQTIFIFKVWLSGIYWSKNTSSASSKDSDFCSIFSKFPAIKNLDVSFQETASFLSPHPTPNEPKSLCFCKTHTRSSTATVCPLSPWCALLGEHSVLGADSAGEQPGFSQRHATDKTWHWTWSRIFVANSGQDAPTLRRWLAYCLSIILLKIWVWKERTTAVLTMARKGAGSKYEGHLAGFTTKKLQFQAHPWYLAGV